MFLYWNTSRVRNPLFFGVLFSLVTNLFFIPNTKMLFGMITLLAYRGLMIFHVIKLIKRTLSYRYRNGSFCLCFFLSTGNNGPRYNNSEYFGIGSGRIALSDYVMNGYNTWLLICSILSVSNYFIVFIEKIICFFHLKPSLGPWLWCWINVLLFF
jgi:hypothetical protein